VTVNPFNLAPGSYQGTITVEMPNASPPSRAVTVNLTVQPGTTPQLSTDKENFSFTFPTGAPPRSQALMVTNAGGGRLDFTVAATTDSGGNWLSATPSSGTATPGSPASVTVTGSPAGLSAGTYTGAVVVTAAGAQRIAPVTMTISTIDRAILLSQTGLSFTGVAGGGVVPPQSFAVLNLGRGVMSWTVTTSTLSGGPGWLAATPDRGSSDAAAAPGVEVRVNPAGLAPGGYYGQVRVDAAEAANTPQVVTVFFEVLGPGEDPGPAVVPSEMIFAGVAGDPSPGSRDVFLYNLVAAPKTVQSAVSTESGGPWLVRQPGEATLAADRPTRIVVQPLTGSLAPGVYRGNLTLQFSDGRVRNVAVTFIVSGAGPAAAGKSAPQAGACAATKLVPALTSLPSSFRVSAGWPVGLEVDVKDDCGVPMSSGVVAISFSNGDRPVIMQPLRDGRWHGTWQTANRPQTAVTIKVEAEDAQRVKGSREVSGDLSSERERPLVESRNVLSAAGVPQFTPLAPGGFISIFGDRLAETRASATALPYPTSLGGVEVIMAGRRLPVSFADQRQINAVIPYDIEPNTNHQLLVRRGQTYSYPVSLDVAAAQPAVFLIGGETGSRQGIIVAVRNEGGEQRQFIATPSAPARAGDVLVIYCAGLGTVTPPVPTGNAALQQIP